MNPQLFKLCYFIFSSFIGISIFSFSSCGTEAEHQLPQEIKPDGLSLQKVIIALKANKSPEKMLAEKQELEKISSQQIKKEVEVIIPTDSATVVESFRNGTLDLGYLSSTDAARNLDQETASILLVHLKNGQPHYQSVWLTLKDKLYKSINDLKNKPVAFASRSSTSGYLIPTLDLFKRGLVGENRSLTDFFSQTIYGNGYVSAVEKVLSGEVEAAAVSDYVFSGDNKYLTDEQKDQLKVLQTQGPVPAHTLCIRSSISESDRKIFETVFLQFNQDAPSLRDRIFNGELIVVDQDEHLKVTRDALDFQKKLKP